MATVKLVIPSAIKSVEPYAKTASTEYAFRTLVKPNENATANVFAAATAGTERVLGVLEKAISSTDSDYASETKVPVMQDMQGIWEFAVGTGTADINDEQGYCDLKDADEIDVTATSVTIIFVTSFVTGSSSGPNVGSGGKVLGKIVRWAGIEAPATN